jgi:hypothetical protein
VLVFGINTDALSIPIIEYEGNLLQLNDDEINDLIDDEFSDDSIYDIHPDAWKPVETEMQEDDITSYTFDVSQTTWLLLKEGTMSFLIYVGDIDIFEYESITGNALSYYASVPDASTMLLLGSSLLILALLGRRKYKRIR